MAALREILVAFGVQFDTAPLEKGEKKIGDMIGKLRSFGAALAGAFAVKQISDFVFGVTQQADVLAKQASALGLSVQELQTWQHAAELAGVSAEGLNAALTKFSRNVAEAADGQQEQIEAFRRLGIEVKDTAGNLAAPIDLLDQVADSLAAIEDPARRTQVVMDLFGRAGAKLLPLFSEGAEGVAKLRAEVEALGGGFSEEFAKASEEVNDQVTRLNFAWLSFKVRIVGVVLPAINFLVTKFIALAAFINEVQKNTYLLQAALGVLATAGVAGAAALVAKYAPWLLMFAKAAALIGLIILLIEDLIVAWQGGDSLIARGIDRLFGAGSTRKVRSWIGETLNAFKEFFGAMQDNPKEFEETFARTLESIRKDIGTLGPFWGGVLQAMFDATLVFWDTVTGGWQNFADKSSAIWDGIKLAFEIAWTEIKFFGKGVIAELADALDAFFDSIPGVEVHGEKGNAVAKTKAEHARESLSLARKGDLIGERFNKPAAGLVSTTVPPIQNVTNVTIPPGTPAQQVRAVAKAAETGGAKGVNRAAKAAITQRGGAKP